MTTILVLRRKQMRSRHQDGWIEETKARTWKAHWFEYVRDADTGAERRRHRSRIVGEKRNMRKYEAAQELTKILAPINATQGSRRDDRVSLKWFVENRWRPTVEGNWGESTLKTNEHFIRTIIEKFGEKPLRELDRVEFQDWLNHLACDYSRSMVFHCFTYLKSMCGEAVEQDFC